MQMYLRSTHTRFIVIQRKQMRFKIPEVTSDFKLRAYKKPIGSCIHSISLNQFRTKIPIYHPIYLREGMCDTHTHSAATDILPTHPLSR